MLPIAKVCLPFSWAARFSASAEGALERRMRSASAGLFWLLGETCVRLRLLLDRLLVGVEILAGHPFPAHGKSA